MSNLKSLTFTATPKRENSPQQTRRVRMIERLEEQKKLLRENTYVRLVRRWKTEGGERVLTEKKVPVRPWWRVDEKGQVILSVKVGYKPIEFEKGNGGIVVGDLEKLSVVIDTLIAAVKAGELDSHLERGRAVPLKAKAA
jgi:hypothetical protein